MKRLETARLLPLGDGPAPFGLHLVLGELPGGDTGPVPLPLTPEEGMTRLYLAALMGDADSVVELAALKFLTNGSADAIPDAPFRPTNRILWERFSRERERLRELRSESAYFPRLLQPDGVVSLELPALVFVRESRSFFEPPCPSCGEPLGTCRDEALLRELGLPSFEGSLYRFLACAPCVRKGEALAVFSFSVPPDPPQVAVGGPDELLRALSRALLREWSDEMLAGFPSLSCREEARRLRKEGGASINAFASRWEVFNLGASPFLLTALSPLRWDEWCDVVGGRPEGALVPSGAPQSLAAFSARRRLEWLGTALPPSGRLFFGFDGTGVDAIEVLALKVSSFRQLLVALRQFYRAASQPHLDLSSGHVLVDSYGAGDGLPSLWTFQVRLHGLASARKTNAVGAETVLPPPEPLFPFAAPEILEFRLAAPRPADVYVSDVVPAERGTAGVRLEGRLVDPNGLFPRPEEPDLIRVTFPDEALGIGLSSFLLQRQPNRAPTYTELLFQSEPLVLDEATTGKLRKLSGVRLPGARYKVFPSFGAPSDLYSAGILFLRALGGREGADLTPLYQGLDRIATRIAQTNDEQPPLERLKAVTASEPDVAALLEPSAVFYRAEDRAPGRPNALPRLLWERTVLLAFRLVTRLPAFSICEGPGDFVPGDPTARISEALKEVERIEVELKTLLFQRQGINWEIQQVLAEIMEEETGRTPPR